MSSSEMVTLAAVAFVFVLIIVVSLWTRSYQRKHPGSLKPGSGSGGILAVFDEIFHPAAAESRQLQQVELELPAPAPVPGGPADLAAGRISISLNSGQIIRVSAAVVLDAEGRMLVVRKAGTDVFMQPGGKPEPGETAAETLVRELAEEVGILVAADELIPLGEFSAPAANEAGFLVVADVFEVPGIHPASANAEIEELRWIDAAAAVELGELLAPLTAQHFISRLS